MILAKLALGRLMSALRAIMGLVVRYPLQCACAGLLIACAWLWHSKGKAEAERDAAIAAKVAQAAEFSAAVEQAERLEAERIAKAKVEQKRISDEVASDYRARIADIDARYQRLRAEAARGSPASQPVPGVPATASGIAAPPDQDGLLEVLRDGSEQAATLDAIWTWIERQSAQQD